MPPTRQYVELHRLRRINQGRGLVARRAGLWSLTVVQLEHDDVFGCRGLLRIPHSSVTSVH